MVAILIVWFSTEIQKRLRQLKFNSCSPTIYMFQLTPGEIHHSASRRESAGDFSGVWTCESRPPRPAEMHPVPTVTIPHLPSLKGAPVVRRSVQLDSSVIQSHITPTSTAASLARQYQTRCQERTESFSSPHNPAKPVQRHLGRTTELAWLLLERYTYTINKRK